MVTFYLIDPTVRSHMEEPEEFMTSLVTLVNEYISEYVQKQPRPRFKWDEKRFIKVVGKMVNTLMDIKIPEKVRPYVKCYFKKEPTHKVWGIIIKWDHKNINLIAPKPFSQMVN